MPDVSGLPDAGRRTNGAVMWVMGQEMVPLEADPTRALNGVPGSPDRYQGRVRVILSEADFHLLQPGEVSVCRITTPVWSILFGNAGALITDGGGALPHAAIIAHEHGIPAVLGTIQGTSLLRDGQEVIVDGAKGKVTFP